MPIHPMAVVDPKAQVHPDATIGPFCVVKGEVTLAAGVELKNHVSVYGRASIGPRTILFPGCVIGSDPQDLKFRGEDSETIVGADCRIHEFVTISKGTAGGGMKTVVGDHCLVMAYAHLAHDCVLGDHVVIANNTQLAGHVNVGRKAIISGMVAVHHFASIGELSFVGAMSGVRFDIPPFMVAEGNPAEPRNINLVGMRRDGWSEEHIRAVKDAFRVLYHDRNVPLSQAVAKIKTTLSRDPADPVVRLVEWIGKHLETSVRGRMQEATREPAVGLRTPRPEAAAGGRKATAH